VRLLQTDVFEKKNKPGKTAAIPSQQTLAERAYSSFINRQISLKFFVGGDAAGTVRR